MDQIRQRWSKILELLWNIFLILFGLFIAYQILRKVFGGSWIVESLIIALLMFNIGYTIKMDRRLTRIEADLHHLRKQFDSLAYDYKEHVKQARH